MAANVYEGLFILDSNRYARDPAAAAAIVNDLITNQGGEILVSRLWEERRLAYPINGQRKGAYWLAYFRIDPLKLTTMTREWQINESILRAMTIKIDPRIVDALVAHAQGKTLEPVVVPVVEAEAVAAGEVAT